MTQEILYKECPLCTQGQVARPAGGGVYRCAHCDLTIKKSPLFGLFKKENLTVTGWGSGVYALAQQSLKNVALPADSLKVVIGNVYSDSHLEALAGGQVTILRPVRTVLAHVILEQLNEECFIQINGLRRGHGAPIAAAGAFKPERSAPREGMAWQDQGNLFCTNHRLVFPSNSFTFIRLDRKLVGVQAFTDGLAVQRKGEDYATYFVGCLAHEAAVAAAYVMARLPILQTTTQN